MTTTFKKTALATLAALTLASTLAVSGAEARPRFHPGHAWGVGAGIAALAASAYAAPAYDAPIYDDDYVPARCCGMVERVNRFGDIVVRRVCN